MAEHVLRGEIAIYPRVEGGKQFLVHDTGEVYRIPLPEEALETVIRQLSLSADELVAELEAQRESQQAREVLQGNGANGRVILPG